MGRLHANRPFLDVQLANSGHVAPHSYIRNLSSAIAPLHLTPPPPPQTLHRRAASTRVQLQQQRLQEQHHAIIVSQKLPGLKTSAAFFASLRTNLRLNASPPPSPLSTPSSMQTSTHSLFDPSPLARPIDSQMEPAEEPLVEDPLAGVPELGSSLATKEADKATALNLVAEGIVQERQAVNQALIFSYLNLSIIVAIMALTLRYLVNQRKDKVTIASGMSAVLFTYLGLCRLATQKYTRLAHEIGWDWLGQAEIMVTRFGDEIIGAAVVDWTSGEARQKRKKAWRGEIRAWTVRSRYRDKGVGSALLDAVVKESRKRGVETLEFADDHANSYHPLPSFYDSKSAQREKHARELLEDLLQASPSRSRRKRGGSSG